MAQLGADVEQLDRLARTFRTEAERLHQTGATLRSLVASVVWKGPDAARFRSQFDHGMSTQLTTVARALREQAGDLGRQASQQRQASASGGGAGGGGGGGGGAGGHPNWPVFLPAAGGGGGGGGGGSWGSDAAADGEAFAGAEARGEYSAGFGDLASMQGWAEAQAGAGAEGSASFDLGPSSLDGEAEGYAFAGLRGEVGHESSLFGGLATNESTLSALAGVDAEGSGTLHVGLDGLEAEADARAFAGARGAYSSETSLFGDFAGFDTKAYAEAGASASANGHLDVGLGGVDTGGGFDVFAGARAGVDQEVSVLGDNVTLEGGAGVRTGFGLEAEGEVQLGYEQIGAEVDLGGAFGLGFDASVGFEFSPSGLVTDGVGLAGDVASKVPVVGGLLD